MSEEFQAKLKASQAPAKQEKIQVTPQQVMRVALRNAQTQGFIRGMLLGQLSATLTLIAGYFIL